MLIGDGKLKPALQARAQAEGLDNVVFHPPVGKGQLAGLMAATDVGLQILANVPAFYYGTSPNKFFDYLASGLPVLNNYPGWLAEIISRQQCGYAVPPDDPVAFADALCHAADHRAELVAMGARARELAVAEFDRERLLPAAEFDRERLLPAAELLSIAVDPAYRGRGIAEDLYAGLKLFFATCGLGEFKIIVGAPLATAHRFYRRMGAVPVAEIEVHRGAASTV